MRSQWGSMLHACHPKNLSENHPVSPFLGVFNSYQEIEVDYLSFLLATRMELYLERASYKEPEFCTWLCSYCTVNLNNKRLTKINIYLQTLQVGANDRSG